MRERGTATGRKVTTLYFVMLGLFTALACAATVLIRIPCGPLGYINFGDTIVLLAGIVLGPVGGAVVGGIGPALADIFSGYIIYAPFTAVIKAVEGLLCGAMYARLLRNRASWLKCLVSFLICTLWVTLGYALTDFLLVLFGAAGFASYGFGAAAIAGLATMPFTLLQMGVSVAVAMIIAPKLPSLAHEKLFSADDADEES